MKRDCGLSFLNGWNEWFASLASNVAVPFPATRTGAGELPKSQSTMGDHPGVVGSTPSHCSALTSDPGVYPLPTIVNGNGFPAASPATTNGLPGGCVIVPAHATPAISTTATATTAIKRRLAVPTSLDTNFVSLGKPRSPSARLAPRHVSHEFSHGNWHNRKARGRCSGNVGASFTHQSTKRTNSSRSSGVDARTGSRGDRDRMHEEPMMSFRIRDAERTHAVRLVLRRLSVDTRGEDAFVHRVDVVDPYSDVLSWLRPVGPGSLGS